MAAVAKSQSHDEAKLLDYLVNYSFFVKLGMWDFFFQDQTLTSQSEVSRTVE
jgi:hypothetical protein